MTKEMGIEKAPKPQLENQKKKVLEPIDKNVKGEQKKST